MSLVYLKKDIFSNEFAICGALLQTEILFVCFDLMEKYMQKMTVTSSSTCFPTSVHSADTLPLGWQLKSAPCLHQMPIYVEFCHSQSWMKTECGFNACNLSHFGSTDKLLHSFLHRSSAKPMSVYLELFEWWWKLQKCLNNCLQHVTWSSPLSSLSCDLHSVKYFLSPRHCWHLAMVICQFPISTIKTNKLLRPR